VQLRGEVLEILGRAHPKFQLPIGDFLCPLQIIECEGNFERATGKLYLFAVALESNCARETDANSSISRQIGGELLAAVFNRKQLINTLPVTRHGL